MTDLLNSALCIPDAVMRYGDCGEIGSEFLVLWPLTKSILPGSLQKRILRAEKNKFDSFDRNWALLFLFQGWDNIKDITIPEFVNKKILIDSETEEYILYGELKGMVKRVANGLADLGLRRGHVVAILLTNTIYYPVMFLAIVSLGAIVTAMNPHSCKDEIENQLRMVGATFIITAAQYVGKVKDFGLELILHGDLRGHNELAEIPYTSFSFLLDGDSTDFSEVQVLQNDTAAYIFSFGSSGTTKAVTLTHRNFIALQAAMNKYEEDARDPATEDMPFHELISLVPLPLFHIYGICTVAGLQLRWGCTNVVLKHFDFVGMLQAIEKFRCTSIPAVPPIIVALAKQPIVEKFDLSSLKMIGCGGASLPKCVLEDFRARFSGIRFSQGYGMTETASVICASKHTSSVPAAPYGSVGYLIPNIEAKIIEVGTGKPLPPHEEGELCIRGPQIMKGYANDPEATAATIDADGWLHTGDLAYFSENGALFILDRVRELIRYKTFQVAPAEIEKVLLQHPDIADAVVVPVPDVEAGQLPVACVVLHSRGVLTEMDITSFVGKEVAPHKKIRGVLFLDSIPRGVSGKIHRRQLARRAAENMRGKS
ncbi:hypothetical protein R1flu_021141 [Riccia fluitans]|uniref:4-coumarate--CoA ligase n=1 Tax=Riccia fluitans TaxID=41844 RepID=A0ABD1ZNQ8_9MARC